MPVNGIILCLLMAVPLGQSMSPAQREVWSGEQRYWDLRTAGRIDDYMSLWLDEFTGWPLSSPEPVGKAGVREELTNSLAKAPPGSLTVTLEPLSIRIHGDFAFVFYRVHALRSNAQTTARIHHTWFHTPGGWKIIAGMSARDDDTPK
jgi:ketosteroid isomerase-like protein